MQFPTPAQQNCLTWLSFTGQNPKISFKKERSWTTQAVATLSNAPPCCSTLALPPPAPLSLLHLEAFPDMHTLTLSYGSSNMFPRLMTWKCQQEWKTQGRARRNPVQGHFRADTAHLLGPSLWSSISTFHYLIFFCLKTFLLFPLHFSK